MAPAPKRIIDNSFAFAGLLTAILPGKHAGHLPPYRQAQICPSRHGVELSRKTLCDWVWILAQPLAAIYERLRDENRCSGDPQAVETPVPFQHFGNGTCGTGYLWPHRSRGQGVHVEWFLRRTADCLARCCQRSKGRCMATAMPPMKPSA